MGQFSQLLITSTNTPLVKLGFQNPNSPQISALRNLQIPSFSAMKIRTSIRFLVSNGSCEMLVPSNPRFRHVFRAGKSDMISHLELEKTGKTPDKQVNGIFWILLLNLGLYVADHWFQIPDVKSLYLYHAWPRWYQFITAAFCHANWNHLSSNLFFLYIFGKLVEEEEGSFALWISYLLTGAGANLVSWMVLPRTAVSVGASGAVFGLFAISVLVKIRWDWRKILEVLILGQFVIKKVMEAAQASAGMSGGGFALQSVNHIAHLSGALIGVSLVWLISRIPSQSSKQDAQSSGRITDKRKLY